MYAAVPTIIPAPVSRVRSTESASPKSPSFTLPSPVMNKLPGLRSRWMMPRLCARERLADLVRDADRVSEWQPMALGLLEQVFERATCHVLAYDKESACVLTD